jgi:hypothetical protein
MFVVVVKRHFSNLDFQVGEAGSALLLLQNATTVAGRPCNRDFYFLHIFDNLSHMLVTDLCSSLFLLLLFLSAFAATQV